MAFQSSHLDYFRIHVASAENMSDKSMGYTGGNEMSLVCEWLKFNFRPRGCWYTTEFKDLMCQWTLYLEHRYTSIFKDQDVAKYLCKLPNRNVVFLAYKGSKNTVWVRETIHWTLNKETWYPQFNWQPQIDTNNGEKRRSQKLISIDQSYGHFSTKWRDWSLVWVGQTHKRH